MALVNVGVSSWWGAGVLFLLEKISGPWLLPFWAD